MINVLGYVSAGLAGIAFSLAGAWAPTVLAALVMLTIFGLALIQSG